MHAASLPGFECEFCGVYVSQSGGVVRVPVHGEVDSECCVWLLDCGGCDVVEVLPRCGVFVHVVYCDGAAGACGDLDRLCVTVDGWCASVHERCVDSGRVALDVLGARQCWYRTRSVCGPVVRLGVGWRCSV